MTTKAIQNLVQPESYKALSNDKAQVMPVQLSRIESALIKGTHQLNVQHTQGEFELIWISEGAGVHVVDDERYQIRNNVIYAALKGQKHELYIHPETRGFILSFNSASFNHFADEYLMPDEAYLQQYFSKYPMLQLEDDQVQQMTHVISLLEKESFTNMLQREIVGKCLHVFLLYLRRCIEKSSSPVLMEKNNVLLKRFLSLIENNFKKRKAVVDYALELNVTPGQLNAIIKKVSGYSPNYHIQQRVVQEAKRKAKHSDASMKEIAYYLGFDDMAHFSKFFKNNSGMNFTDFKRLAMD
jgi:AraC-like DNA-binding protein/mannose-6-phosphate isomerase-like protein (cupin superfamily)